jgi:ribonuclease E
VKRKILINAVHPEEKRVAIIEGQLLVDFYMESASKALLKGNIYKGVVKRIEPALRAAFVDFGPKKHGFLQMSDIRPEYFRTKPGGKARPKIQDVITKGQELLVQVERDERDTKGASLTTHISIPGRYLVMMPGSEGIHISRKITGREERDTLKKAVAGLDLPKGTGFIIRTAGGDRTGKEISNDLKYLTRLWKKIQSEAGNASAPSLVYEEQDISVRTVRDYLTSDINEVLVDDKDALRNIKAFLRQTMPWRRINVNLHKGDKPVFDRYDLESQIAKLSEKYVYLPSKGYLVIDKTEALTAIDVNSGRSRKEKDMSTLILTTNLEAADELARQLRLRDIGGLIIIDFIDMLSGKHRREVEDRLKAAMEIDRAQSDVGKISKFGLVEMTRERRRAAYLESTYKQCPVCEGAGVVKDMEVSAIAAFRDIHMKISRGGLESITCRLPVDGANYLTNTKREELAALEKSTGVRIHVVADPAVLPGHYFLDAIEGPKEAEHKDADVNRAEPEKPEPEKPATKKTRRKRTVKKKSGPRKTGGKRAAPKKAGTAESADIEKSDTEPAE